MCVNAYKVMHIHTSVIKQIHMNIQVYTCMIDTCMTLCIHYNVPHCFQTPGWGSRLRPLNSGIPIKYMTVHTYHIEEQLVVSLSMGAPCRRQPTGYFLCGYVYLDSRQSQTELRPLPSEQSPTPTPTKAHTHAIEYMYGVRVSLTSCCSFPAMFLNEKGYIHMSTAVKGSGDTF